MSPDTETPIEAEAEVQEDRPSWLPSQFEGPEMLAKSWREASRKITEQGQQLAELARENEQLTQELESLLAARDAFEERITLLERGLLKRLVSRKAVA